MTLPRIPGSKPIDAVNHLIGTFEAGLEKLWDDPELNDGNAA
jgi:hypothetical protein